MAKEEAKVEVKEELCGHINRHSYGIDGQLDNLSCTLPKGHQGQHSAMHTEVQVEHVRSGKQIVGEKRTPFERMAYWLDGAGIPADQIPAPAEITPPTMLELEFGKEAAKSINL